MKQVLILMSDTGGGHRAAAEAIQEALRTQHGEAVAVELVDVFRDYSPFPFNYMPEFYPWLVNNGKMGKASWGAGYKWMDKAERARFLGQGMHMIMEDGLKRMYAEHPADVVVCVHSVIARPAMETLMRQETRPPYITVVTDLVSTPMFWYEPRVERCLVPTQTAYDRGLRSGLTSDQLRVTGLPVHPNFTRRLMAKADARAELGWNADLPAIVLVGGGEGMGPLYETAVALDEQRLSVQLVVVAGRNQLLREKLEQTEWHQPVHIYPFVTNMPVLMAAADMLVTKAGPSTIMEACQAGLPMILNDAIPGQEDGNVEFVLDNRMGEYATTPETVADTVRRWMSRGPEYLAQLSANARSQGAPQAVWDVADEVWAQAQRGPITNTRRKRKTAAQLLNLPKVSLRL